MEKELCHSNPSNDFGLTLLSERKTNRQYNAPTVSEVAALIINDFGDGEPSRDIIVNKTNSGPQRISELHPSYMTLQYPLLYPYGEDGFHEKVPYHTNTGERKTKHGPIISTIEEQRLKWTRNNQDTLRVDLYHNLSNVVTRGDTSATGLGKRIVLPRSFTGGPRYMMQNYQDAMALCRTYGNPDLFITFTPNPKWPKITDMLAYVPGQKSHDRPEIGCRVFKMKLTKLLDDLTKKKIGDTCAVLYVTEVQKCGLPHTHILVWLEERWKCRNPAEIDDIISAELPSPIDDPEGYKVVTEYIMSLRSKEIKYLFKYLNKGPDRATIGIQENVKGGIASLLLPGGRTAHSIFIIPLKLMENSTYGIKQNTHLAELLKEVKLIIWDEAPMTRR
ncbi:helicase [Tanacetum coccineum]